MFYRLFCLAVAVFSLSATIYATEENSNHIQSQQTNLQSTGAFAQNTTGLSQAASAAAKVNINKATMKDLMGVKGLTRVKAKNILTYRKKHGEFKSLEDLKLVKGFKKMNVSNLKAVQDQMTTQ